MFRFRHLFARRGRTAGPRVPLVRPRLERLEARDVPATVVDPNLAVRTVVSGLDQPTSMAFLGTNDFLVGEKATGRVQRVKDGKVLGTVLDLPVNNGSERGLLGLALHPNFRRNGYTYLYWTQSNTGVDTGTLNQTTLLGNRVDRYIWNGTNLLFDRNILELRALQQDANQPERGNHDGGVIEFGPDGKLYVFMGDNGRRGQMQNLPDGPGPAGNSPDDQFGGPEPDGAHATGAIFRLNDDGSTPRDNPFYRAGSLRGGDVGATLQKIFAYGVRNGFGMAFDPLSRNLWDLENGDDSFSELNRVEPGSNLGWVEIMGPVARVAEFKAIETSTAIDPITQSAYAGLQQVRWNPSNIANTPQEALERMYQVYEGGNRFTATLSGAQEVPAVTTTAAASAEIELRSDGTIRYTLRAVSSLTGVTQAHFHLGARNQNGPVVADLLPLNAAGVNFAAGSVIAQGVVRDSDVREFTGFDGTAASLAERMRQGRVYANVHSLSNAGGLVRGQVVVVGRPVSHYVDPDFSWRYEVAPGAIGFISSSALGSQYRGDMVTGAARVFLNGGQLFRFDMTRDRRHVALSDARLQDRVADNKNKFDITESETLLFGSNFGIVTDIQTGPNGNLYVLSLSDGVVYEIYRRGTPNGKSGPSPDLPNEAEGAFLLLPEKPGQPAAPLPVRRPEKLDPPAANEDLVPGTAPLADPGSAGSPGKARTGKLAEWLSDGPDDDLGGVIRVFAEK